MTDLNCYITTFNCGRSLIDVDYFAANFFNGLKSNLPPDLVVLALEEIAPIAYCFVGGSLIAPYFARFVTAVNAASSQRFGNEREYPRVVVQVLGMTGIVVLARSDIDERIRWIETAGVGFGHWEMGNKGAAAVRMGLSLGLEGSDDDEMDITFVAAHLAPMEWNCERRNQGGLNLFGISYHILTCMPLRLEEHMRRTGLRTRRNGRQETWIKSWARR